MSPPAHADGTKSPIARFTVLPVAMFMTRSVVVTVPPQVSSAVGMVTYASWLLSAEKSSSPAKFLPESAYVWVTTPAEAMRIASVAFVPAKHTDSSAGPRSLSGHDVVDVTVVSPSETGSTTAEYADCICISNAPQPQPPCGTRANAMPEAVQPTR